MSTIALKISSLLVRTLAKPIANTIKNRAKHHGPFRRVCIGIAQVLHQTDVTLRQGLGRNSDKVVVRPLNDTKAIDMGANFLSETFLFSVAAGAVIFESMRSSRKEANRREGVADDIADLQMEISDLKTMIQDLKEANDLKQKIVKDNDRAAVVEEKSSAKERKSNSLKDLLSSWFR
ncbi:optic atrophy 3 protein-domain-containing protein [Dipodascopsis uninucleata]